MTYDDADLTAVRSCLAARASGIEESQSRTWATIATRQAATGPPPASVPAAPSAAATGRSPARWLVPVGAAAAVAAVALGSVSLLGGGGGKDGLTPAVGDDYPLITDPDEIALPLDEYFFTTEGYQDFQAASAHLTAQCLQRFEVDVSAAELMGGPLPEFPGHQRRLGVFDLEVAQEYGYGAPPGWGQVWPEGVAPADPGEVRRNGWEPSEEEYFLYAGRSASESDRRLPEDVNGERLREDGCNGEAVWILSDGMSGAEGPDWQVRNSDAGPQAAADARMQRAEAEWSDCMREAGYRYERPLEAGSERYRESDGDGAWDRPASPEEIADAVANVECKIETNLVGVWVAVMSEYQQQHIQEHWEELQQLRRWLDNVDENSTQVLADAATDG